MTRTVTLISVILFLSTALPHKAAASFWIACDVKADVEKTDQDGLYRITPHEAVVIEGHMPDGTACLEDKTGNALDIRIEGEDIPVGADIALQYRYYNAMGPGGVVESETWAVKE
jgi:hypothetical protein